MTLYNLYLSYSSFIHTYCDGSQYNNNSYIHNYETKSVSALYFKEDATYFEANDDSEIHNKWRGKRSRYIQKKKKKSIISDTLFFCPYDLHN